jgi:hypothetical protein
MRINFGLGWIDSVGSRRCHGEATRLPGLVGMAWPVAGRRLADLV